MERKFALFVLLLGALGCGLEKVPRFVKSLRSTDPYTLKLSSGNFRLTVTDAPFSYDLIRSAFLTISKVEVRTATGESRSILSSPKSFDLIPLRYGRVLVLASDKLPAGSYSEVKLSFSTATVVLTNGKRFELRVPAGASSGVTVPTRPAITVTDDTTADLLVDIDLSRTFLPLGDTSDVEGVTGFTFFPVLRSADVATCGALGGQVFSNRGTILGTDDVPLAGVIAELTTGSQSITAVSEEDGVFQFLCLPEGTYSLKYKASGHRDSTPVSVEIRADELTTNSGTLIKDP